MQPNCHLLLQNIKEAIIMLDKDGYIQYSNPATTTITGYTANELLNNHLSLIYSNKEDSLRADYELRQAFKNGKFLVEGWKLSKNGDKFWCEISLTPLYNEQEEHVGYSCILHDTNDRKKHEIELRQSEERYRLMVEGVRDYAIFMLNPTGHIITWNEGARRTKGYSSYEIIGKHFSTFYTAEDLEDGKPERELKIAIATGKYEEEGWRVKKNGSVFWANVVITSLFNEQNQLIGFSKVTRDLTDRKENEESLRQSEERYRSLVEQVTDYGIFMLDEKGRIISWNEGARRMKGYNPDEILGKYFSIFYPEEDIMNGKPSHELRVAREVGKYEEEGWRLRKDGTMFWASVVITAVYNHTNTLIGYSKVTRDLTERKASERALRDSYERYRQLSEELKATNDELMLANQEMEQFTSIVSHDLQEPVRTIKSFLQLIDMKLNQGQYEDLKTYISKSINASNRMKELIQNLLSYTQVSKKEIAEDEIRVEELFNIALQNVKTTVETTNAEIIIESDVDTIHGDSIQLVQLIQNLLSNALKFTDVDSPRIMIKCNKEDGQVKFAITDNGIGIAEEDLGKIFEIFRRLNTKKEYPGTGIGLAICKKIVDRHRGRIWPVSEKGKGTTFYFTINEEKVEKLPLLQ
ncbi:PAS domain-containing sensor histidine kinase [Telluribacter humicola]|uniref:PAS domain-containing sensor histidine kinase n=1 Tax=Telluribacter humicola TaxID=1720261 RepID=UPI001A96B619|nr:PAS domain-containing sensor histidine kinase [Telluribacter humicola]